MLSEYALDPELLSNWKDFRFFASQFGAAQGRLISRFPKKWKGLVMEAASGAAEITSNNGIPYVNDYICSFVNAG